jgi:hypothetical protein
MKTAEMTPEQKAKKAAYDKAYRERKKAEAAKATAEVVEATVVETPKAEKAPKAPKAEKVKAPKAEKAPRVKKERPAKRQVAPELLEMIQPLRTAVDALVVNKSTEQMTFIQNELRRLSRTVKKAKAVKA